MPFIQVLNTSTSENLPPQASANVTFPASTGSGISPCDQGSNLSVLQGVYPCPQGSGISIVADIPDEPTEFSTEAMTGGVYTDYYIESDWTTDYHTIQMPVASTSVKKCSFAVTAQPTMRRIVNYTSEKLGSQPADPAWILEDTNYVLLQHTIHTVNITTTGDGATPFYKVNGSYVYAVVDSTKVSYTFPIPPTLEFEADDAKMPNTQFINGITS